MHNLKTPSTPYGQPDKETLWQERAVREGRGLGSGEGYIPWLQVRRGDFPSRGKSALVPEPATGRQHHQLSMGETDLHMQLLRLGVREIMEQYPLRVGDWDPDFPGARGTARLAEMLNIPHPRTPRGTKRVLTTDVLTVDASGRAHAIFYRPKAELPRKGTRKFRLMELQKSYWRERKVAFGICTEFDIPPPSREIWYWARDGHAHCIAVEATFLDYLRRSAPYDQPLSEILAGSRMSEMNATLMFKAAVCRGSIRILSKRVPLVSERWSFEVLSVAKRAAIARSFFDALESSCA
jgi:hypothetical protein